MQKLKLIIAALLFLPALTLAEFDVEPQSEWRVVEYDQINFSAKATDSGIMMEWSAYPGEGLEWYKIVRSTTDNNPVYPDAEGIGVKGVGELEMFHVNPVEKAYYRVCAITKSKQRSCSNVIWVETEAKARVETPKKEITAAKQPAKHIAAKAKIEKIKTAHLKKTEVVKEQKIEKATTKNTTTISDRLNAWAEKTYERLEASTLTAIQKIEKIEKLQARLLSWGAESDRRTQMVEVLNGHFSKWLAQWQEGSDIDELDSLLDGLLDD